MCMKSFIYDNYMSVCCLIVIYFAFTLFKNNMKNFLAFVSILIFACTFSLLVETDNALDYELEKKYKKDELKKIYNKMQYDENKIRDSDDEQTVVALNRSENSISHPYRDVPVDRPYLDHSFTDNKEQKLLLTRMC